MPALTIGWLVEQLTDCEIDGSAPVRCSFLLLGSQSSGLAGWPRTGLLGAAASWREPQPEMGFLAYQFCSAAFSPARSFGTSLVLVLLLLFLLLSSLLRSFSRLSSILLSQKANEIRGGA